MFHNTGCSQPKLQIWLRQEREGRRLDHTVKLSKYSSYERRNKCSRDPTWTSKTRPAKAQTESHMDVAQALASVWVDSGIRTRVQQG